jgi:hypothetical protein
MTRYVHLLIDYDAYRRNTLDLRTGCRPTDGEVQQDLRRLGMEPRAGGWWRGPAEALYRFSEGEIIDAVSELATATSG